jgi:hypothetical protein
MKMQLIHKKIAIENINSWSEIVELAPIDLKRLMIYAGQFESAISTPIMNDTIEFAKKRLYEARNNLDLFITTLLQILYDREILQKPQDHVLFSWLQEDLGRFMQALDSIENMSITAQDNPNKYADRVGIARLCSYSKDMKNAYQALFEGMIKSIKEFYSFEEKGELKRTPRIFLYILMNVLQVTFSVLGSLTRNPDNKMGKKGNYSQHYQNNWQSMVTKTGQENIKTTYEKETGNTLPSVPDEWNEIEEDSTTEVSQ